MRTHDRPSAEVEGKKRWLDCTGGVKNSEGKRETEGMCEEGKEGKRKE